MRKEARAEGGLPCVTTAKYWPNFQPTSLGSIHLNEIKAYFGDPSSTMQARTMHVRREVMPAILAPHEVIGRREELIGKVSGYLTDLLIDVDNYGWTL